MSTAIQEFEADVRQVLAGAEQIVIQLGRLAALREANRARIDARIAAAQPGEFVGDSRLTRERALEISALFDSFAAWLTTEITVDVAPDPDRTMRPRDIILARDS